MQGTDHWGTARTILEDELMLTIALEELFAGRGFALSGLAFRRRHWRHNMRQKIMGTLSAQTLPLRYSHRSK
jgi:hypothetical protein